MDTYRVANIGGQIAIFLTVIFGGIGVWTTLSSKVDVLAALQARQSDDIKELKNKQAQDNATLQSKLDALGDKLTDLKIQFALQPAGKKQ